MTLVEPSSDSGRTWQCLWYRTSQCLWYRTLPYCNGGSFTDQVSVAAVSADRTQDVTAFWSVRPARLSHPGGRDMVLNAPAPGTRRAGFHTPGYLPYVVSRAGRASSKRQTIKEQRLRPYGGRVSLIYWAGLLLNNTCSQRKLTHPSNLDSL